MPGAVIAAKSPRSHKSVRSDRNPLGPQFPDSHSFL